MRRRGNRLSDNHLVIGVAVLALGVVGILISYSAQTGLPFVPTYSVTVEVPDATRVETGAPVRSGGVRVGVVQEVRAVPATASKPEHARLLLGLDPELARLPVDSRVTLRPISVLGGKYVAIDLGESSNQLAAGQPLPLDRAIPTVEIEDALRIFDPQTARALQRTITGFGGALAGRGESINLAVVSLRRLMRPIGRVADVLAAPSTGLGDFIESGRRLNEDLAPVAPQLGGFIDHAGPTLRAFRGPGGELGEAIDELPTTSSVVRRGLAEVTPGLRDLTVVSRAIRPGTRRLAATSRSLERALETGRRPLRGVPSFSDRLGGTFASLDALAQESSTDGALRLLTETVDSLRPTLEFANPAQTECNLLGVYTRNLTSASGEGDAFAPWNRTSNLLDTNQLLQRPEAGPNLHFNPYPRLDETECEAGNEPFEPGQVVGNPKGKQPTKVPDTAPPDGVTDLAREAGLLDPVRGAER